MSRSRKRASASSAAKNPHCEWDGEDSVLLYGSLDDLFSFDARWLSDSNNNKHIIFCHRYYIADEATTTKKKHQERMMAKFKANVQELDDLYKELRSRMHKLWRHGARGRHTPGYIQLEYEGKQLLVQQYSPSMLRRQRPEKTLYSVEGSEYTTTEVIPGDKMQPGVNIITAISLAKKLLDVVPATRVFKTVADYNLEDELRQNGLDPDKVDEEREREDKEDEERQRQYKRRRNDHYDYQYNFSGFDAKPAAAAASSATFATPMERVLLAAPNFFKAREWNRINDGAKLKTRVYRMFSAVISADKCGHGPLTEDSFTRVDETVKSSGSPDLSLAWGQLRSLMFLVFPKSGNTDSKLCQEIAKVVNSAME